MLEELAPDRQERGNDAGHVRRRLARAAVLAVAGDDLAGTSPVASSARTASGIWLDSHEIIFSPGATRSGLMRPSPVGPFDEKYDTP